ncbi:hypothetical protein [uncultured Jatrophihabitans sp.]|uniref:hypothetical protein n=1 Tax=uncultured Jatrophihabitans sp. TaxID=1610747 RepID=UPI0035C9C159
MSAVAINLTVTGAADGGYLTAYAAGAARPTTSNLDFAAKKTVANLAIVPISSDDKITIYNGSSGSTPVIGDVVGYYTAGSTPPPGGFASVAPSRVLDTRSRLGASTPGANATIGVQVGGRGGVPSSGVSAVAVNLTVTRAAKGGYLTAYAAGAARPVASNVNFPAGSTVATLAVVPVGSDGKINIFNGSGGSTPVIGDVAGYYRSGTAARAGTFTAVPPARVLDTRSGNGASTPGAQATIDVQVAGRGGVPAGRISAVVLNLTVTRPTRSGYVTAFADGEDRPTASNLNFGTGSTVANLAVVPVGDDGKISIYNGSTGSSPVIADVTGYVRDNPWQYAHLPTAEKESRIDGLSCVTSTHCVAVGSEDPAYGSQMIDPDASVADTLDGGTWTSQKLPAAITGESPQLEAVSCTSETECVAVGSTERMAGYPDVPLVERLSGGQWTATALPQVAGREHTFLRGISCTSATSCIAVGNAVASHDGPYDGDGLPIVEQLSGNTWTEQTLDVPSGYTGARLNAVVCSAAAQCVAVGAADKTSTGEVPSDAIVDRLSGTTWTPQVVASIGSPKDDDTLNGLTCFSSSSCLAVGAAGNHALVATIDASAVVPQTLPDVDGHLGGELESVSCVAVGECTAVGGDGGGDGVEPLTQTLHAGSWSADHPPFGPSNFAGNDLYTGNLLGVSCSSSTHCVAIGTGQVDSDSGAYEGFVEARS